VREGQSQPEEIRERDREGNQPDEMRAVATASLRVLRDLSEVWQRPSIPAAAGAAALYSGGGRRVGPLSRRRPSIPVTAVAVATSSGRRLGLAAADGTGKKGLGEEPMGGDWGSRWLGFTGRSFIWGCKWASGLARWMQVGTVPPSDHWDPRPEGPHVSDLNTETSGAKNSTVARCKKK
jgi:hypothetical protein